MNDGCHLYHFRPGPNDADDLRALLMRRVSYLPWRVEHSQPTSNGRQFAHDLSGFDQRLVKPEQMAGEPLCGAVVVWLAKEIKQVGKAALRCPKQLRLLDEHDPIGRQFERAPERAAIVSRHLDDIPQSGLLRRGRAAPPELQIRSRFGRLK